MMFTEFWLTNKADLPIFPGYFSWCNIKENEHGGGAAAANYRPSLYDPGEWPKMMRMTVCL